MDDVDDSNNGWIALHDAGDCHWTKDLGVDDSFSTTLSHFSLRVDFAEGHGGARTDCRQAAANEETLTAEIKFGCCSDVKLRDVRVTTDPPMPVSYLRVVPQVRDKRVRAIECTEVATFPKGTGRIGHTQLTDEHVYLQLGTPKPKRAMPDLLLDDIVVDDGTLVLTRDGVTFRLMVQRARGKMRSAPNLSSPAITLDIKKLEELKFKRAELEVIK